MISNFNDLRRRIIRELWYADDATRNDDEHGAIINTIRDIETAPDVNTVEDFKKVIKKLNEDAEFYKRYSQRKDLPDTDKYAAYSRASLKCYQIIKKELDKTSTMSGHRVSATRKTTARKPATRRPARK